MTDSCGDKIDRVDREESLSAVTITKVRIKVWESGCGTIDEMKTWVYEVFPDGRMVKYTYRGQNRKYEDKKTAVCGEDEVTVFYQQMMKLVQAVPNEEAVMRCDGNGYRVQVSFSDGRKVSVDGWGGGVMDGFVRFLQGKFE